VEAESGPRRLTDDRAQERAKPAIRRFVDPLGRLRPFESPPPELLAEIASFEVVRTTVHRKGDATVTEELIRVKLRDRGVAEIAKRGGDSLKLRVIRRRPLKRGIVRTVTRNDGRGATAAAGGSALDDRNPTNSDPANGESPTD